MKRTALGMMLAVGVLLGLGANSFAVYYVDDGSGSDANDGSTWGTAWKTVTNALTQATSPSEIWVKAGIYYPTTDGDRTKSITMKAGVDIYGGFDGTESSRDQRNWSNNPTIFSGDLGAPGDPADNSIHVVVGATARIDGFIIRDGNADTSPSRGGGMYTVGAYPITANCIFSNNLAGAGDYTGGGGVYWYQETYTACTVGWYNCTFDANTARSTVSTIFGGGLYAHFLTNTVGAISNCIFRGNIATSYYGRASALYLVDAGLKVWPEGSAFEVVDCVFSNNSTLNEYYGGAVVVENFVAPVVFRDCQFVTNYATSAAALLVSCDASGQGVQMTRCVFDGNMANGGSAPHSGGAVRFVAPGGGTNSFWRNCVFKNNTAKDQGGAIFGVLDGTFDTCDFVNNSCPNGYGGAIYASGVGSVPNDVFTNCTFMTNSALAGGGALDLQSAATLKNCAFESNRCTAGRGGAVYIDAGGTTSTINQCTFASNEAQGNNTGGAISLLDGYLTLTSGIFTKNRGQAGGAIHTLGNGNITASDCLLVSNSTTYSGGAVQLQGPGIVQRSVFVGNTTVGYGGGIYFYSLGGKTGVVANCMFRDNLASEYGGAILNESANIIVSNVTAYTNRSGTAGTGGALRASADSTSQLINCILWDNSPVEIGPTAGVTVNYSCVKGGFAGTGNISVDPLFADAIYAHLQSKNGYYDGGYFTGGTLLTSANNSPAIDAGDPASDWSLEPVPNGSRINMGAYGNTEVASKSRMVYSGTVLSIR